MIAFLMKGGVVMIPLFACSLLAVYIFLERLLFLFLQRLPNQSGIDQARSLLLSLGRQRAANELLGHPKLGTRLLGIAIRSAHLPHHEMHAEITAGTHFELPLLDRHMGTLSTIVTAAPLLGLLGTVLGLMNLFGVLGGSVDQLVNPMALLGGISEALITTVSGLIIALLAILFHQFLQVRIDTYLIKAERLMQDLVYFCKQNEVRE